MVNECEPCERVEYADVEERGGGRDVKSEYRTFTRGRKENVSHFVVLADSQSDLFGEVDVSMQELRTYGRPMQSLEPQRPSNMPYS
jgi:hypothetical protein